MPIRATPAIRSPSISTAPAVTALAREARSSHRILTPPRVRSRRSSWCCRPESARAPLHRAGHRRRRQHQRVRARAIARRSLVSRRLRGITQMTSDARLIELFPPSATDSVPSVVRDELSPGEGILWIGGPDRWGLFRATPSVLILAGPIGLQERAPFRMLANTTIPPDQADELLPAVEAVFDSIRSV